MKTSASWLDKTIGYLSPQAGLRRMRSRVATEMLARFYEAASVSRRTQGWNRSTGDANSAVAGGLSRLRELARDLVRNNSYADSALDTIADHTIGAGIMAAPENDNKRILDLWMKWTESTDCDADGRNDFYGLQHLVVRSIAESGEVLVRRRRRYVDDGFVLPLQIQVLEPDFLDTTKMETLSGGRRIIHGVEFDALGKRIAYWLFREHPGSDFVSYQQSVRIPATDVLHIYLQKRPGQVRGPSWFASTLLKFKDFDEFEDATLMKQKIAACLAVLTSDVDGSAPPLGAEDAADPEIDSLEPGMIMNVPPGRSIQVVNPPVTGDYLDFSKITLRAIATGIGVSYEDLTGDYTGLPFSAARMSRIRHWARVDKWRWQMMIPQFCDPVWAWAMEPITILSGVDALEIRAKWTPPPPPLLEPQAEAQATSYQIRTGILSLSEAIRGRGYEPKKLLQEIADDNKLLDKLGLALDCDGRVRTQQGNAVPPATPAAATPAKPGETDEEEEDDAEETEDDEGQETDEDAKAKKKAEAAKKGA